ncbi:unnamed protein product [Arctogadus glacialis]
MLNRAGWGIEGPPKGKPHTCGCGTLTQIPTIKNQQNPPSISFLRQRLPTAAANHPPPPCSPSHPSLGTGASPEIERAHIGRPLAAGIEPLTVTALTDAPYSRTPRLSQQRERSAATDRRHTTDPPIHLQPPPRLHTRVQPHRLSVHRMGGPPPTHSIPGSP